MDFPFDLNALFPERISVLDHNLDAGRKPHGRLDAPARTATVIDELGKASAKAQQLAAPITSASKLQSNRHHLYLLKDGERNGGRGVAVGYLKVGCKKLFLLDQQGAHVETEPLCVLDFYVTESLQRHGYGLELFHFMLEHKKVKAEQMAYDRPSSKFLAFLEKHFDLKHSVPQVNNFVVFDGFFRYRSVQLRKAEPKRSEGDIKPYSLVEREAVREEQKALPWPFVRTAAAPPSPPLGLSSQFSRSLSVGSSPAALLLAPPPSQASGRARPPSAARRQLQGETHQGLVARSNLYSRHISSRGLGLLLDEQLSTLKLPGLQPVVSVKGCDTGGKADALGHTNTSESTPPSQNQAVSEPPLPGSRRSRRPPAPTADPPPTEEAVVNDQGGRTLRGGGRRPGRGARGAGGPGGSQERGGAGTDSRASRPVLDSGGEALYGPVGQTEPRTSQHTPLVMGHTDPGGRSEERNWKSPPWESSRGAVKPSSH